jgi:hypothetical protein
LILVKQTRILIIYLVALLDGIVRHVSLTLGGDVKGAEGEEGLTARRERAFGVTRSKELADNGSNWRMFLVRLKRGYPEVGSLKPQISLEYGLEHHYCVFDEPCSQKVTGEIHKGNVLQPTREPGVLSWPGLS